MTARCRSNHRVRRCIPPAMPRKRSRSARAAGKSGRRGFLLKVVGGSAIIAGAGVGVLPTGSFTITDAERDSPVDVAAEGDGIVGIIRQNTVKRNSRDSMVKFINNGIEEIDVEVSLNTCGDGTLYNNGGNSGCSVVVNLPVGKSRFVDIEATATGAIPYDVSISEDGGNNFQLLTSGSIEGQSGRVQGAIRIQKPVNDNDFTANPPQGNSGNNWTVASVDVRDDDGDTDLTEVKFEVRTSGQGVVGSETVSNPPSDRYKPNGNPVVTINPNSGYTIQSGTQYTLTVTGTDADGNFATSTVDDTA